MIEYKEIKRIVEALIFASDNPVNENRIKNIIQELNNSQIQEIIEELNSEYDQSQRSFRITKIAGGYQFITKPEFASYIKQYYKGRAKSKLSRAGLETLAIIAFNPQGLNFYLNRLK